MKILQWTLFVSAIGLISGSAFAQDVSGDADEQNAGALEEVIVSAQKRDQSLQDVPIAIQAFSYDELIEAGVDNSATLQTITPSLNITFQLQSIQPYIRGVGSPDSSLGQEASVATYVDGVYISNPNATIFTFNNVERVEVLKGPQGTLFGRNATGGLIHVITKDPAHDPNLRARFSYGSYDTLGANIYGSTGFSENVAADIAIYYKNQDEGFGDNLTLGVDINKTEERAFRSKWLFTVSERTEIRFSIDYAKFESSTGVYNANVEGSKNIDGQIYFAGCVGAIGGNPAAPTLEEFLACQPVGSALATTAPDDFQDSYSNLVGVSTSKDQGAALRIDHDFGSVAFASITSYREGKLRLLFDQTVSPLPLVNVDVDDQSYKTFSQEFQLLSQNDGPFTWILGAYFYDAQAGYKGPKGLSFSGIFIAPSPQAVRSIIDTTSLALYGEGTWSLTDRTRLTAGLRWTKDKRDIDQKAEVQGTTVVALTADESWDEPTWRLVLDHDVSDSVLLYGSYSRGFKSGNFNAASIGTPPVDAEILDALEVGMKTTLADGRVRLNGAAFFYQWSDLQLSRVEAGSLVTVNAAEAEVKGLEFDLLANVTDNFQLRAGFSWLDTEYTDFPDAPVYSPDPLGLGGNVLSEQDVSGNKLVRVPDYTINIGGYYTIPSSAGEFVLGATYYYNDGFFWEASNRLSEDNYSLLTAMVSWRNAGDSWGLRVYGSNLLDEEYSLFTIEQQIGDNYEPAPPATWGVEVTFDF